VGLGGEDFWRTGERRGCVRVAVFVMAVLAVVGGVLVAPSRPADGAGPPQAAVHAPLVGVSARGLLVRLERSSLRPVSRGLPVASRFVWDYEFSPNGRFLAVGEEARSRVLLFDVRRWRPMGTVRLPSPHPGGYGGAGPMQWVGPRRLLVMAGPPFMGQIPVVVDPRQRRVVRRVRWRGLTLTSGEVDGGLVLLAPPSLGHGRPRLGPARLVHVTVDGRVRSVRLDRIDAGEGQEDDGRGRVLYPGLAVDRRGNRAFVVAADRGLVAEVDLRSRRVAYHALVEPPAAAKGGPSESFARSARWLGANMLAVSGEDLPASEPSRRADPVPHGLRLVDTRTWTIRTVDPEAQTFDVAGGLLLARRWYAEQGRTPMGVAAYDFTGRPRWRRFSGSNALVWAPGGRHVYVDVGNRGKRRTHMVELSTGRTVRTLPHRRLTLLRP
jgi:hypothetical protein